MTPERWRRLDELYRAALARDPRDRALFLRDACAGDDSLRRAVESLLAQPVSAGAFLEEPALAVAAQVVSDPRTTLTGHRIGVYEIQAFLGAGGMGDVYRARDTKLGRDVAIKILPRLFTSDPERLTRFEREARMLASLNHPHIGAIYGFEEADGVRALILELVEGRTLAERVAKGPIPLMEALGVAKQVAEAIDAAHERGIVHRDLKPANIMITPDGTVKVLDFGLAKAAADEGAGPDLSQSPTVTNNGTREGMILGTAAYMSPEQACGKPVDKRSDVWAFGCVLYEMLSGRAPFARDTTTGTLAAILEHEPNWHALPPAATPVIGVLRRCLEKDVKRRLRDIGDVQLLLEETTRVPSATASVAVTSKRASWMLAATGLIVGVMAGGLFVSSRSRTIPQRAGRFELMASPADRFTDEPHQANVAISPDGSRIIYTAIRGGFPELVIRRLDQLEPSPMAGSEGGTSPFFSPDGQQVGFETFGELKRVAADGGTSVMICRLDPTFRGASWGPNDTIVFAQAAGLGLFRVSAAGGAPEKLAAPDATRGEEDYLQPAILPDGQAVLYTVLLRGGQTRIVARRLRGGDTTTLVEGGFGPQYLTSGHLVYAQGDRLMAVRFDVAALQVTGSPVRVLDGVLNKMADGVANVASAADGTTVYVSGGNSERFRRLVWVDRRGTRVAPAVEQPLENPRNTRLSSDGRRLALTLGPDGHGQIWVYDLSGATQPLKLTFQGHNTFPIWSPDGKQIVFVSLGGSTGHMSSIPADGSAVQPEHLRDTHADPLDWSPNGFLLFQEQFKLWLLHVSDEKAHPWLQQTPFNEFGGRFSPEGHWVAYTSNQTGPSGVWVRPFPGPGAPIRISPDGGRDPAWSRDGKELFYHNGPKLLSARVVSETPNFRAEPPRVLFEGGFVYDDSDPGLRFFDVAPDGRFLMIEPTDTHKGASIIVVQHWDDELKRLVSIK